MPLQFDTFLLFFPLLFRQHLQCLLPLQTAKSFWIIGMLTFFPFFCNSSSFFLGFFFFLPTHFFSLLPHLLETFPHAFLHPSFFFPSLLFHFFLQSFLFRRKLLFRHLWRVKDCFHKIKCFVITYQTFGHAIRLG